MPGFPQREQPKTRLNSRGRGRRFLRRLWKCFVVYVMVSMAVSLIPEGSLDVEVLGEPERVEFSGALVAGTGRAVITPPKELWGGMNLYAERPPITGALEDLHVRALTLGAAGSREVLSIVGVELIIITSEMRDALQAELVRRGLDHVHFLLNATHNHSGPANFYEARLFGRRVMGPYNRAWFDFLITRFADAIEASTKTMRPARIGFGSTPTRQLIKHRRFEDPVSGLRPPVDEDLEVIRVDGQADGKPIAYVLNLGVHPINLLHKTDGRIAADFPETVCRRLEETYPGAAALFLQGAPGSVRGTGPRPSGTFGDPGRGEKFGRIAMQSDMLLGFVREAEAAMSFDDRIDLSAALVHVRLPGPDVHLFPEEKPWLGLRILTLIPNRLFNWVWDWIELPDETVFQAVRINHAYLLTFPCDLSNPLGWEIKQHVRRGHVLVLGQSNDYSMGYVMSREAYDLGGIGGRGGPARVQNFYGKRAGPFCVKTAGMLANMVREADADDVLQYDVGDGPGRIPREEPR